MGREIRVSPFWKQCFVTAGVSLNMSGAGLVMGFTTSLLQQLQSPESRIPIDESSGSWIAAIPGFSLVVGNFVVPTIMARYGRKTANLISLSPMIIGWICVIVANSVTTLYSARFLHGLCMGMCASLGSTLIGEYASPKNRGAFLMTISVSIAVAVLSVHAMGSYLHYTTSASVCGVLAVTALVIVIFSPESPSWLADQGRYEDCKKIFHWLRGYDEEEELTAMIEASVIVRESKADVNLQNTFLKKLKVNLTYFNMTIRKREFYRPILIMMHIYAVGQWCGINLLVVYPIDLFKNVIGPNENIPLLCITLDAHRLIATILALYVIRKVKRRSMVFSTAALNITALLALAVYSYQKDHNSQLFENAVVGSLLIHILMLAVATGTLSLSYIIAGEIFPLEYRSLAGGISVLFYSINLFIVVKTLPYLLTKIGLYGVNCLSVLVISYCFMVIWFLLPETKDRTLQDIEDEFRGRPLSPEELKSVQSLTSFKPYHRCNSFVI